VGVMQREERWWCCRGRGTGGARSTPNPPAEGPGDRSAGNPDPETPRGAIHSGAPLITSRLWEGQQAGVKSRRVVPVRLLLKQALSNCAKQVWRSCCV
jgi:hypothetical protein